MKSYKYLVIAAAATVFAACSKDENSVNGPAPIRLSSSLTVLETRAGTNIQTSEFLTGEKVDVFISEDVTAGGTATTNYDQPLVYTTGNSGALTPATQPYFPGDDKSVNIHAVYPSGTVSAFDDTAVDFTVKTDQSTDAGYKASDLMYGAPENNPVVPTYDAVVLKFNHLLSKVTVTLKAGNGSPSLDKATVELLNVSPTVEFTPSTHTLGTVKGTATDITVMKTSGTSLSGSAVIIPQTLGQQFIRVTLSDNKVLIGQLDNNTAPNLTSGNEYKYDITVHLSTITVSDTIEPWADGGTQNGTATM